MPTKTGSCVTCGLDVDLIRGKCAPHPAKDRPARGTGSKALCEGVGTKPAAEASPGDPAPTEETPGTFTQVTLQQALLEDSRPKGAWAGAIAESIDPRKIDPDPTNPRALVGDVSDLAASLIVKGMLQPVVVTPGVLAGRYTLVFGHRRLAAAHAAGMREVPALVRKDLVSGSNLTLTAQIVENFHREPLLPAEEARTFEQLRKLGMKQADIATAVGCNQAHVSRRLALLKLPDELQARVGADGAGSLDVRAAEDLARLDPETRDRVVADVDRGHAPAAAISRHTREAEATRAYDQLVSQLEEAGTALVDFPQGFHWSRSREDRPLSTGSEGEPQPYGGARTIDQTWEQHADEPCHGAAISPSLEVIYVCLDPTRHGYPTAEQEAADTEATQQREREEREAAKALEAAAYDARTAAAKVAALSKLGKADMATAVIDWAVLSLQADDYDGALPTDETVPVLLDWLGLDGDPNEDLVGDVATLVAAEGPARVAYMATIAAGDIILREALQNPYGRARQGHPAIRRHLETLTAYGYVLNAADQAIYEPLPEPAPPADADADMPDPSTAPADAVAWWAPLEGDDEARWVPQDEADALAGISPDRLVYLHELEAVS